MKARAIDKKPIISSQRPYSECGNDHDQMIRDFLLDIFRIHEQIVA
jgi:hypothetical protein